MGQVWVLENGAEAFYPTPSLRGQAAFFSVRAALRAAIRRGWETFFTPEAYVALRWHSYTISTNIAAGTRRKSHSCR